MPEPTKTYIVNDQPTDTDALDFTPYVETLADIIQTGNTPLTIGVFGTWGSGKTSLMKMVKKNLPNDFTVAWFDAWKYDKEETLWRAFLLSVLTSLKETAQKAGQPTEEFEKMQSLLYREMELEKLGGVTIDLPKFGGAVATGLVKLSLSFIPGISALSNLVEELQSGAAKSSTDEDVSAITRERTKIYIEQVQFLEQFQEKFAKLVKTHIVPKRLVVFVDDLDRCLPEKAIEVLESIKLFLDVENCIFVLGVDQEVIARGIELKYKEFDYLQRDDQQRTNFSIEGLNYLEKIIQLPFQIPPIEVSDMDEFVRGLGTEWPDDECPRVFAAGLGSNPRKIKRTVNTFFLLWKLAEKRREKVQDRVKPIRLAKVVAIQAVFPDLYNLLFKNEPRYLRELEEHYRNEFSKKFKTDKNDSVIWKSSMRNGTPPSLIPFLSRRGSQAVEKILTLHSMEVKDANFSGLPIDDLKLYFTLTARSETPRALFEIESNDLIFEPQMILIPEGEFLMGSTMEQTALAIKDGADQNWVKNETPQHSIYLSDYFIGKYPITNLEYQAFIVDAKYKSPQGWEGDQFPDGKGGHPVVSVSWGDANMYCEWLSKKTGKPYRLPTEAEWEKAARGTDGRIYPWGDTFVVLMANTAETKIGDTSDVGKFSPQGDSPYGCADMVGNVWEWCSDWLDENEYRNRKVAKDPQGPGTGSYRVLRGGSFINNKGYCRCTDRGKYNPFNLGRNYGFRVAYTSDAVNNQ
mgnify:CR=1 FL=1